MNKTPQRRTSSYPRVSACAVCRSATLLHAQARDASLHESWLRGSLHDVRTNFRSKSTLPYNLWPGSRPSQCPAVWLSAERHRRLEAPT